MNGMKAAMLTSMAVVGLLLFMPSCKAKTCDTANNIDGDSGRSRKRVKNIGLFSKKEMRRKKW